MNITIVGNFNTGWDGSICDERHIADALVGLGHSVDCLQRENVGEAITNPFKHVANNCDFILIAQWDGYPEDMIEKFRIHHKGPIAYWAFDYQEDGQDWHERLIKGCDVYLSKPLSDAKKHKNWRWLSQDFAPSFLNKYPSHKEISNQRNASETHQQAERRLQVNKDIEVLFTGSWVPWESGQERVKVLKAIDEKYDLHIYGVTPDQWKAEGFKNVYGPVIDRDLPALIARAKVNFSMDHVWAPGYWSDRTAQIMACRGFVLFRHVPLSEAVFRDCVEYFYTTEDCLEKIEKYLKDDGARANRAWYSHSYARDKLMVGDRAQDLLTIMGEFI